MVAEVTLSAEDVGEVIWVVDGTIGLASGDDVQQVEAGLDRGAEGAVSRLCGYVVLPEGAQQVRAVLDDEVGTVVPFETVPLGSETLGYRLLDGVEVAHSDTGVWDVSWRHASGEHGTSPSSPGTPGRAGRRATRGPPPSGSGAADRPN